MVVLVPLVFAVVAAPADGLAGFLAGPGQQFVLLGRDRRHVLLHDHAPAAAPRPRARGPHRRDQARRHGGPVQRPDRQGGAGGGHRTRRRDRPERHGQGGQGAWSPRCAPAASRPPTTPSPEQRLRPPCSTLSRWKVILVLASAAVRPALHPAQSACRRGGPLPLRGRTAAAESRPRPAGRLLPAAGGRHRRPQQGAADQPRRRHPHQAADASRSTSPTSAVVGDAVDVRITDPAKFDAAFDSAEQFAGRAACAPAARDVTVAARARSADRRRLRAPGRRTRRRATRSPAPSRSSASGSTRSAPRSPIITQQGATRIVVEAPGESDPEKLKAVIGKTAKLTFQMVDSEVAPEDIAAGRIPPDDEVLPSDDGYAPAYVRQAPLGRHRRDADQASGRSRPRTTAPTSTSLQRPSARSRFAEVTSAEHRQAVRHRARQASDLGAPTIRSAITGGSGQITGHFTEDSAHNLALLLKSGALPAPLNVIEQHTVGAELGADAVAAGQISIAHRRGADLRLHHPGLRPVRRLRGHRPDRQRPDDRGRHEPHPGHADPAGHRRPGADPGRRRRRQRADLRAHARRGAGRAAGDERRRRRLPTRARPPSSTPTSPPWWRR